ncbi:sigma factor [Ectothiorhodospira shaposhnikovii]|uniref:sigma factor n=1 Tax=Ectothiorhodospira shaposhnikovii TaxID=1054 RepID=UPI001EE9451F|nr:sigma factor [Ectothiorhodospira shaposhnikovii]MCG5512778.1 hypothetical protein [Ectothiorhodospira shaposhnikovii]
MDMKDQTSYENNLGLILHIARKCHARILACHIPMEFDDVVQEISLTWLMARDKFDPDAGFRFSTYFVKSAYTGINRLVETQTRLTTFSYDEPMGDDQEGSTMLDLFESDIPGPEAEYDREAQYERNCRSLSKLALTALNWLIDPPDFVMDEYRAMRAQADMAQRQGFATRCAKDVDLVLILNCLCKTFGVSKAERYSILRELRAIYE